MNAKVASRTFQSSTQLKNSLQLHNEVSGLYSGVAAHCVNCQTCSGIGKTHDSQNTEFCS